MRGGVQSLPRTSGRGMHPPCLAPSLAAWAGHAGGVPGLQQVGMPFASDSLLGRRSGLGDRGCGRRGSEGGLEDEFVRFECVGTFEGPCLGFAKDARRSSPPLRRVSRHEACMSEVVHWHGIHSGCHLLSSL